MRGVGRAPVVWTFQIKNDLESMPIWKRRQKKLNKMSNAPLRRYEPYRNTIDVHLPDHQNPHPDVLAISRGEEKRGNWDKSLSFISYLYTLPIKLISSPFIDAMGKSAWQIMLRRIDLLFHTHGAKKARKPPPIQSGDPQDAGLVNPNGPLSAFLKYLSQNLPDDDKTEITLVGHSMGAIVMNRILREFGDELPIRSVVYMAAASSIQDYKQSVFPFLENHPQAQIYHLTLHDTADIRDRWNLFPGFDPPPRGSLLIWVDDFLSDPKTPLDHSLGRFGNTVLSAHDTPEEYKERIHIKEFSLGGEAKAIHPQHHGDFSTRFMFWKPECWRPNTVPSPVCYSQEVLWD